MPEVIVSQSAEFPVLDGEDILVIFQVTVAEAPFTNSVPVMERETASSSGKKSGTLDQTLVNARLDDNCWNIGGRTLVGVCQTEGQAAKGVRRRVAFRFSTSGLGVSLTLGQNAEKEFFRLCGKVWNTIETYSNPEGHPACIICKGVSEAITPKHVLTVCEGEIADS